MSTFRPIREIEHRREVILGAGGIEARVDHAARRVGAVSASVDTGSVAKIERGRYLLLVQHSVNAANPARTLITPIVRVDSTIPYRAVGPVAEPQDGEALTVGEEALEGRREHEDELRSRS